MAQRLLLASGNITEARRKDTTDFEQAKELAAIKQKYTQANQASAAARADAKEKANAPQLDPASGNWILPPSVAFNAQLQGAGSVVGTTWTKKGPQAIFKPANGEPQSPPAGSPRAVPYTQGGSSIPAPTVVPPPPPAGGPPAPAGLKPITLSSGKTVYADEKGNIVNVPK
jgi:hypothetical protein